MFDVKAAAKVRISEKKTKFYLSFLEREYLRPFSLQKFGVLALASDFVDD